MIIAVDPGTVRCGVAVWEPGRNPHLVACFAMTPPRTQHFRLAFRRIAWLWERFTANVYALDMGSGSGHTLVVEHLRGSSVPLNPALDLVITSLRQWADEHQFAYQEYSPRQWRTVVALKGAGEPDKEGVRFVMEARYPELRALREVDGGMDAIEAAAIGLHHAELQRVGMTTTAAAIGRERA